MPTDTPRSLAPINGQLLPPWRDMPYGRSTVGRAGCEGRCIAYNQDCGSGEPASGRRIRDFLPGRGRYISGFFVPLAQNMPSNGAAPYCPPGEAVL